MPYNDKLDPEEQVITEETIAATIFDNAEVDEETAAQLGRDILLDVLKRFRPDLMENT